MKLGITLVGVLALIGVSAKADTFGSGANIFTIDFANIGNAGNGDDLGAGGGSYSRQSGGVGYDYRMGVTEVPQNWITKATNLGLAHVIAGAWIDNKPAAYMSWFEAAAFVNWLNTSTGHHVAYDLTFNPNFGGLWESAEWTPSEAWDNDPGVGVELNISRHKDAYYFLPSDDEWYKTAYHKNDGVTANYWDFATGSNDEPVAVSQGIGAGTAVYGAGLNGPADVDNDGGLSPYGTRGQNGNVWEWEETWVYPGRIYAGGGAGFFLPDLRPTYAPTRNPSDSDGSIGFRVASVATPEPSCALLLLGSGWMWLLKRRRAPGL